MKIAAQQTIRGPLTAGAEHHRFIVKSVRKPRKNGNVTATVVGHLPGVGDELIEATVTITFPNGEVTAPWEVVGGA